MLTNEQRAHDLAILILDDVKNSKVIEASKQKGFNPLSFKFNYYEEYLALYKENLELLNKDFKTV